MLQKSVSIIKHAIFFKIILFCQLIDFFTLRTFIIEHYCWLYYSKLLRNSWIKLCFRQVSDSKKSITLLILQILLNYLCTIFLRKRCHLDTLQLLESLSILTHKNIKFIYHHFILCWCILFTLLNHFIYTVRTSYNILSWI